MNNQDQSLIFEISTSGRIGYNLPEMDVATIPLEEILPADYIREEEQSFLRCPNWISCVTILHFPNGHHGVDSGFIRRVHAR